MRKIITTIFAAALIFSAVTCQAAIDYQSIPISQALGSKGIALGDWYDTSGELTLQIGNDYTINGAEIISVGFMGDTAGFYKIRVKDGDSYRDIELQTFGSYDGDHVMLIMNNTKILRQTQQPKFYESIGGIYLGMPKSKVMEFYGEPLNAENQPSQKTSTWTYTGFEVFFSHDVVTGITIYKSGDRRFDLSGLSASSSIEDFERKYDTKVGRRGALNIGHGEIIVVNDGRATLQMFTAGFAI